ncbi:MarR family winged helix-turn-helix transcriptional regulator [Actinocorallia sp. A-T 12471]|uniref:MarR family winged helix-turn-helix transcriptional regulator n=1 Tax=Actinocorallia sp. A-T 12471 TaxID=3089813 RepID=UPI0029CC6432|nr:MarR family transcriptional regulator [Actinocorallia sp. A-T 12471]MDX6742059.1 MarR family transcriptional regulator [Actinocorallia sp. A-T 12471]
MGDTRWLDAAQQGQWRSYLDGSSLLVELLDRDLKASHGLSMSEYEILVRLSEAPNRTMRMAELAQLAYHSRSRLSHTCARMEAKGLVVRVPCDDDKRGVNAVLTDKGFEVLAEAAHDHVATVREYLVDLLTPEEFEVVGRVFARVAERARRAVG